MGDPWVLGEGREGQEGKIGGKISKIRFFFSIGTDSKPL